MTCLLTDAQRDEAFLAAPPMVSRNIIDLTVKHPSYLRDIAEMEEFPLGNGASQTQLVFRGAMPSIERGFEKWAKVNNNVGCNPCNGPSCAYNTTYFGGTALQRKQIELMTRDFRSPGYCVKEIQTTAHFMEFFGKTVENLYAQVDFFKSFNINFNAMTEITKKFVIDSDGPKYNGQNVYVYPGLGTKRISTLTIDALEFFYEYMVRAPSAVPLDVVDGAPIFTWMSSSQAVQRLFRDDPQLRQDARFSGLSNDLLLKYNFNATIRGMFVNAPILYPRRFNNVAGTLVEVLPFVNDIPGDVGSYTDFNPQYQQATHEEGSMIGKYPFKIFYQPTATTLGANSSFGPEVSYFNNWQWINPMTEQDPLRRLGFFMTEATIAISPQYSDSMYGLVFERPSVTLAAGWLPPASCPPDAVSCNNSIPASSCPEPLVVSYYQNAIDGSVILQLATPTTAVENNTITFGIDTGGYLTGTVVAVSTDGFTVQVTFPNGTDLGVCDHFTTLFCNDIRGCSSQVANYSVNCSDATRLDLILQNQIVADTASDVVTLFYGDGTTASATVVSVDMTKNLWIVDIGSAAFCDNVGGVVSICVPTSTDASCPSCTVPASTYCSSDCGVTA